MVKKKQSKKDLSFKESLSISIIMGALTYMVFAIFSYFFLSHNSLYRVNDVKEIALIGAIAISIGSFIYGYFFYENE